MTIKNSLDDNNLEDLPSVGPSTKLKLHSIGCLLYTSDAADEEDSVDLGGRRIIKKKKQHKTSKTTQTLKASKRQPYKITTNI